MNAVCKSGEATFSCAGPPLGQDASWTSALTCCTYTIASPQLSVRQPGWLLCGLATCSSGGMLATSWSSVLLAMRVAALWKMPCRLVLKATSATSWKSGLSSRSLLTRTLRCFQL